MEDLKNNFTFSVFSLIMISIDILQVDGHMRHIFFCFVLIHNIWKKNVRHLITEVIGYNQKDKS